MARYCAPYKDRVGRWGEAVALRTIQKADLFPIQTNWRTSAGEIDIVAIDRRTLVVIEVKTRLADNRLLYPALSAIDSDKRKRLTRLLRSYRRNAGPICRRYGVRSERIDAIEVYYRRTKFGFLKAVTVLWRRGIKVGIHR